MGRKNIIKSNRKVIAEGLRDGVPIGLGYLAVSFSLGIAAKNAGLNFFQVFLQVCYVMRLRVNIRVLRLLLRMQHILKWR